MEHDGGERPGLRHQLFFVSLVTSQHSAKEKEVGIERLGVVASGSPSGFHFIQARLGARRPKIKPASSQLCSELLGLWTKSRHPKRDVIVKIDEAEVRVQKPNFSVDAFKIPVHRRPR